MNDKKGWRLLVREYRWRIVGFLTMLFIAILFLTLGFWKTILIVLLCTIGVGIGYAKDRTEEFLIFLDKIR